MGDEHIGQRASDPRTEDPVVPKAAPAGDLDVSPESVDRGRGGEVHVQPEAGLNSEQNDKWPTLTEAYKDVDNQVKSNAVPDDVQLTGGIKQFRASKMLSSNTVW